MTDRLPKIRWRIGHDTEDVERKAQALLERMDGYQLMLSPELLSDEELDLRISEGPELVWRDESHWRQCRYASNYQTMELISRRVGDLR